VDTGRMAFRSQTRRARGGLGLPFFISCGRSKMKEAQKTPIWVKNNMARSRYPIWRDKLTDDANTVKKARRVRKPKALRGMR
jgi:hypothetical protein